MLFKHQLKLFVFIFLLKCVQNQYEQKPPKSIFVPTINSNLGLYKNGTLPPPYRLWNPFYGYFIMRPHPAILPLPRRHSFGKLLKIPKISKINASLNSPTTTTTTQNSLNINKLNAHDLVDNETIASTELIQLLDMNWVEDNQNKSEVTWKIDTTRAADDKNLKNLVLEKTYQDVDEKQQLNLYQSPELSHNYSKVKVQGNALKNLAFHQNSNDKEPILTSSENNRPIYYATTWNESTTIPNLIKHITSTDFINISTPNIHQFENTTETTTTLSATLLNTYSTVPSNTTTKLFNTTYATFQSLTPNSNSSEIIQPSHPIKKTLLPSARAHLDYVKMPNLLKSFVHQLLRSGNISEKQFVDIMARKPKLLTLVDKINSFPTNNESNPAIEKQISHAIKNVISRDKDLQKLLNTTISSK